VFARDLRQRHAGHLRQALNGFRKTDTFALHDEVKDAAVLARGKIKPGLLLVVYKERRRLLLVERRQALEFTSGPYKLHAPADDLRNRKPGFELVEELRREAHGLTESPGRHLRTQIVSWRGWQRHPHYPNGEYWTPVSFPQACGPLELLEGICRSRPQKLT